MKPYDRLDPRQVVGAAAALPGKRRDPATGGTASAGGAALHGTFRICHGCDDQNPGAEKRAAFVFSADF